MRRPKTNNINQLKLSPVLIEIISQRYDTVVELWESFMVKDENDERLNHPCFKNYKSSQEIKQSLTEAGFCTLPGVRYFIQYINMNKDDYKYFYDHLSGNTQQAVALKYNIATSVSTKEIRKGYYLMERFTNAYGNIRVSDIQRNDYVILDLSHELLTKLISYQCNHFYRAVGRPSYIGHLLINLSDDKFITEARLDNKDIEEIHSKYNDLRYKE